MRTIAVDYRLPMTRRGFLRVAGLALAAGFTAIADELARLFRWCANSATPWRAVGLAWQEA